MRKMLTDISHMIPEMIILTILFFAIAIIGRKINDKKKKKWNEDAVTAVALLITLLIGRIFFN